MILIILGLSLAGFIIGFLMMPSHRLQWLVGGTSLIIMAAAAILMIGNDTWHWGMHQETTITKTPLRSTVKNPYASLLLYSPIKRAKTEKVYVYQSQQASTRQHSTASLKTTNRVQRVSSSQAHLITHRTYWHYDNQVWATLFRWTGHHQLLVRETNTFQLPANWEILSVSQAKWLSKHAQTLTAKANRSAKQAVKAQVKSAVVAQPNLSNTEISALTTKVTAAVQKQAQAAASAQVPALLQQAKQHSIYD